MKITKNKNGNTLEIALEGRLDTVTAPELEDALKGELKGVTLTRYDMTNLEYVSSARCSRPTGTWPSAAKPSSAMPAKSCARF